MFQVIEFYASGAAMEEYRPRSPQELGLHPRDVTLFAPISRLAAPQRATIAVHDGKILVKTEIVKAIITADKAVLIKGRRLKDTHKLSQAILMANEQRLMALRKHEEEQQQLEATRGLFPSSAVCSSTMGSCERAASAADLLRLADKGAAKRGGARAGRQHGSGSAGLVHAAAAAAAGGASSAGAQAAAAAAASAGDESAVRSAAGSELKDVPFEMLVLEVLLDATAEYFYTKVQHLNWMLESIAADLRQPSQPGGALDRAHQLIPIQKFLTHVKNDVKETCEAIQAALEDDETLQDLCLSWHLQQKQHTRWVPVELQRHGSGAAAGGDLGLISAGSSNGNGTAGGQQAAAGADATQLTGLGWRPRAAGAHAD
ncbi:hypothetical protein COO60DRAFT_221808 [Scenedesmus sp. NREL 46B-D3]|nr:hypothetical protein COO60DRAFT_221808 [Scenedesmus sp. NREL 46B-D3]